jgi:nucleolar protein 15
MSSTILKRVKKSSKTKTKQPSVEVDAIPIPSSKEHKLKQAKPEEDIPKSKTKLFKGEGTKRGAQPRVAKEVHHDTVPTTRRHANQATRPVRKPRGPWKAPSPSPSLSPTSDFEAPHSEEDEPEASQEEAGSGDENVHLYGFSTDEESSDDDLDVDEGADLDVGSLPTVARDDATVKRKLEKAKRKPVCVSCSIPAVPNVAYYDGSAGIRSGCHLSQPNSTRLL